MSSNPTDILKYLNGREVVKLSHVCQNFFYILQNEHLWSSISERENQVKEADIFSFAKIHAGNVKQTLINYHAREKLSYIFHLSIESNWKNCRYEKLFKNKYIIQSQSNYSLRRLKTISVL